MNIWNRTVIFACIAILALLGLQAAAATLNPRFAEAERLYAEGSYKLAHDAYQKIANDLGHPEDRRWVEFRLAETAARFEASTRSPDDSAVRESEAELREFIAEKQPVDRIWAESHEALADILWFNQNRNEWHRAWPHYSKALDFWAGSTNLTFAAERYWSIVQKASQPPRTRLSYHYGQFGNYLPLPVIENALKIARNEDEHARAHFMIAMGLRNGGSWEQRFRIPYHFEESLKLKKDTGWYDDALYFYGHWMASQGDGVQDENGNWTFHPHYTKALEVFRRLVAEFREGESQWVSSAQQQIRDITHPSLVLSVAHIFLPESEIEYIAQWRNIDSVEFRLYKVDITRQISFAAESAHSHNWMEGFDSTSADAVKTWKWEPKNQRPHTPGSERIRLEEKLPVGAYILVGAANGVESRELILVSDLSIVMQSTASQVLVFVSNSSSGAPAGNASVRLWEGSYENGNRTWKHHDKSTGENGLILFELELQAGNRELFVTAKSGDRQALSSGGAIHHNAADPWRVYAFTDRPAYRPGEKVHWKVTARQQSGDAYSVPNGQTITMRIIDPRGTEIRKEKLKLNDFGSAWGDLDLSPESPLGQYTVSFQSEREDLHIGNAVLFRLEEYKLPEFKVTVQTPQDENGRRKTFLLGEEVEVEVSADYYFGGPVVNATVEAIVYQNPYYHHWVEPREFPWLHEDIQVTRPRGGHEGQVVQRQTLTTDAEGRAKFVIQSPLRQGGDLEYRIEARVTDASRREVIGSDHVRVTRQRFYVQAHLDHRIHKPQDKISVEFRAEDANKQPVVAEGKVHVTRDYWWEIWISPDGREVQGDELKRLQSAQVFPPITPPGQPGWRVKFRGYQHDEILTRTLKTSTNGLAILEFTVPREGYYHITWRSDEEVEAGQEKIPSRPVLADTYAWVATGASADLGYRSGALEILIDQQSLRAGEIAPVMLSVPGNDRYVLFTVHGRDLIDYQLVHLEGSVKLLNVEISEHLVPNAFLHATMVGDQQLHADQEEIVVPPVKNFLTVSVTPDRDQYLPGEKGVWRVKTLDHQGEPVSAEVALGIVDDSVYYIQEELAADPRRFFFGTKRYPAFQTTSSFSYRSYAKLLSREEELARDERYRSGRAGERLNYYQEAKDSDFIPFRTDFSNGIAAQHFTRGEGRLSAAPAPAPAAAAMDVFAGAALTRSSKAEIAELPAQLAAEGAAPDEFSVQVRTDFRSTIVWQPGLKTDSNGEAEFSVNYPDSLTTWRATARAVTAAHQFGIAREAARTKMPLIVRLQAPRFFLVGDTVTVSAVINNNTDSELDVTPSLEGAGIDIPLVKRQALKVAAGSQARVDWILHPRKAGEIKLKVTARGREVAGATNHADSMERAYTVYEHGIDKFVATSGKSLGSELLAVLRLPGERKPRTTEFSVAVTPSLAITMLDALPYLVNYPYGCVEQTMSRFLPAAITAKTLSDFGLEPEDVLGRVFGGTEPNAPMRKSTNNLGKLSDITTKGLQRLYDFQQAEGGWGWWKESDADPFMSAYVLWGLVLARDAKVEVKDDVIRRAASWLDRHLVEAENQPDLQAWLLHALAVEAASRNVRSASEFQTAAFNNLWQNRDRLNAYTRALFALSAHHFGKSDEARALVRNLENGVQMDNDAASSQLAPGRPAGSSNADRSSARTAHWGNDGIHYRWSEGGIEATAFALRAMLAIDPDNDLIEPVANWLIKNRRGAQWSNTRDTAIVLLALNDYLRTTREIKADLDFELFVNGSSLGRKKLAGADVFNAPSRFNVPSNLILDGDNQIRIVRHSGSSPIYFAAEASFFSLEEPVASAGNEIFVKRQYYRLRPVPTLLKGYVHEKIELRSGDQIHSGERLETVLTVEAKNHYEYLVFEDLKPAGIEAVEIRSGEPLRARRVRAAGLLAANTSGDIHTAQLETERYTGESRHVYQELRDRKVALFIDKLAQGFWEIRYETRAEIPGEFHALPVVAHAMYVPEIRANSAEQFVQVIE